MYKKIYIELSDICALDCSFCPNEKAKRGKINLELAKLALSEASKYTKTIAFHILGDPLFYDDLPILLDFASDLGLSVEITTSLIYDRNISFLFHDSISQINISLSAFVDLNNRKIAYKLGLRKYVDNIILAIIASCNLELGILDMQIQERLRPFIPLNFKRSKPCFVNLRLQHQKDEARLKLKDYVFMVWQKRFAWKDERYTSLNFDLSLYKRLLKILIFEIFSIEKFSKVTRKKHAKKAYCHGLISQIAITSRGNVIPCCIDSGENIVLGEIKEGLSNILNSSTARKMRDEFLHHTTSNAICKKCTYKM